MIDVAHDGDYGRAFDDILGLFRQLDLLRGLFFVADFIGGSAEVAGELLGHLGVQGLVDGSEDLLLYELLDHQIGFDAELFRKLFYSDSLGNGDLAVYRRRRGGLIAPRGHAQTTLFLLHIAVAVATGGFALMTALLFGCRERAGGLDAHRRRGMHRALAGAASGSAWALARNGGSAHHGLAGTNRSAINR